VQRTSAEINWLMRTEVLN